MKKMTLPVLTVFVILVVSGCGGEIDSGENTGTEIVVETTSGTETITADEDESTAVSSDSAQTEDYGQMIAGFEKGEQYALADMGEESQVLLVAAETFEDDNGYHAAALCDVYDYAAETVSFLGTIGGGNTVFPVRYGNQCLYTADENSVQIYVIDSGQKELVLQTEYRIVYNEDASEDYYCVEDGVKEPVSEDTFWNSYNIYNAGTVVNFQ